MQKMLSPQAERNLGLYREFPEQLDKLRKLDVIAWATVRWALLSPDEQAKLSAEVAGAKLLREEALCRKCKGKNWVYPAHDPEHFEWAGKVVPCDHVWEEKRHEKTHRGFDNWKPVRGAEAALEAAKSLGDGTAKFLMLLIYGGYGNGKTHLAQAIMQESRERNLDCSYWYIPQLVNAMHRALAQKEVSNAYDSLFRHLCEVTLLVLDDWGVSNSQEVWARGQLEAVVKVRYESYRALVLTTNRDLTDLPPGVLSLFSDRERALCALNEAPDYRPKRKVTGNMK